MKLQALKNYPIAEGPWESLFEKRLPGTKSPGSFKQPVLLLKWAFPDPR